MSDKLINSKCICGSGLIWKKYNQIMLEPCEHIVHNKCWIDKTKCPICKQSVTRSYTKLELKNIIQNQNTNTAKFYQKYVDMCSMTNFDNLYSGKKSIINMIDIVGIMSSVPFLSGFNDGKDGCREVLSLMDAKIVANGLNYIDFKKPRVFICNHTTYLDFVVIFYLFKCGFLASSVIHDTWIGRKVLDIIPLLVVERGKDTNTVEKMRKYVEDKGSICLFPEGMITHPDTLIRFRSGAFHIGYPIYPVVLRYDPIVYDTSMNGTIAKITTDLNLTIYVDVLPAEYPPFDNDRIEEIRRKMGKAGNLALSRVSNRDIKD